MELVHGCCCHSDIWHGVTKCTAVATQGGAATVVMVTAWTAGRRLECARYIFACKIYQISLFASMIGAKMETFHIHIISMNILNHI